MQGAHYVDILSHVNLLKADNKELCCLAVHVDICAASGDFLSNCQYLLASNMIRIFVWIVAFLSFLCNCLVLGVHVQRWKKSSILKYFIFNLCLADLLMSLYLIMLASADLTYRGIYVTKAATWRRSSLCRVMAVISTTSSEMSLYILMMMSVFQGLTIQNVSIQSMKQKSRLIVMILLVGWIMITILSILPVINLNYFGGKYSSTSGSCLIFNFAIGQDHAFEYSITFSIVVNVIAIILMCAFYIFIIYQHFTSQMALKKISDTVKRERRTCILLTILLASNLLCWLPMLSLMIYSYLGGAVIPEVSSWFAVFILPLNSLTDPFLYTFRNINFKKKKKRLI